MPTTDASRRQPLDVSGSDAYLHVDARGNHLRLTASARRLLDAVESGLGFTTIANAMSRAGTAVDARAVEQAYRRLTARLDAIATRDRRQHQPWGFWCRRPLLSAERVARWAKPVTVLLAPMAVIIVMISCFVAAPFLAAVGPTLDGGAWSQALPLFILSMFAHELGHAAASLRFGAAPARVGFTFYLIYPAFYSDVTRTWGLRRGQRVAVDLAGNYVQLAVGLLYTLLFVATGWTPLAAAAVMIGTSAFVSLNPVFRLDGYWALADALGVTRPVEAARNAWHHLLGRRTAARSHQPRWTVAVLLAYGPLCLVVWSVFAMRLVPAALGEAHALPDRFHQLVAATTHPAMALTPALARLALSLYVLTVAALFARLVVRRLAPPLRTVCDRWITVSGRTAEAAAA